METNEKTKKSKKKRIFHFETAEQAEEVFHRLCELSGRRLKVETKGEQGV